MLHNDLHDYYLYPLYPGENFEMMFTDAFPMSRHRSSTLSDMMQETSENRIEICQRFPFIKTNSF